MSAPLLRTADLDRRVRFERPVPVSGFGKAGQISWEPVATVSAQVRDVLPSRGERVDDGLPMATRRARIRIRYRAGITSDMRVIVGRMLAVPGGEPVWRTDRTMQIIAGPAEIGRREGMELTAEDYSTAGGTA